MERKKGVLRFWAFLREGRLAKGWIRSLYFVCGLVLGMLVSAVVFGQRSERVLAAVRERAEQAAGDLREARTAQQLAQERAGRLQEELARIGADAGSLQDRTGKLAAELERISADCAQLTDGIGRAQERVDESGNLIAELGSFVQGLQGRDGEATERPE